MMDGSTAPDARLILAGAGDLTRLWPGALPPRVEVHNDLVEDKRALQLFRRCGLLVLPYRGATQSALIPAAYFFRKPVVAAPSGALEEYIEDGRTGWVVDPGHPPSLARCLSRILSNLDQLAEMGTAGRAWYDARRQAEEDILRGMYENLSKSIGQSRGGRRRRKV
jgi:glycosyltransferase involved in cell wall biosynthesis